MIEIKDTDLPITVAEKIITGTKPYVATPLTKAVVKAITGSETASDTVDMFSLEEIKEIADYLMVYYESQPLGGRVMTNQEARGILANLEADYRDLDPLVLTNDSIQLVNERIEALGMAISALQAQDVPDTNVGDMISRQAAIEELREAENHSFNGFYKGLVKAHKIIAKLPPAQSEIVRCKDCEHWKNGHLCEKLSRFGSFETKADFYCGYPERITAICEAAGVAEIDDLSDGFHTFRQLYYQRMMLFATIVKQNKDKAWKSLRHEDGELCFGGGWFIVGIDTPEGSYTYHYEDNYYSLFDCEELECGKHWDGHTEKDVTRLLSLPSVQPERRCVNCGRTVNNGGWYEDGRTRCPIEEHYALPKDGYCHLWEKRKDWEDDYVKRAEEGEK